MSNNFIVIRATDSDISPKPVIVETMHGELWMV